MVSRLVVVGGDAAGMSAASSVKKALEDVEVVVLERSQHTSYSACGVPYWVAGSIESADELVARSPEEHRERGIDLRTGAEATAVDTDAKVVTFTVDGREEQISYDRLLVATGAYSTKPDLPGIDAEGVLTVKDLDDGQRVLDRLEAGARRAVIVGSGYIGLEMAEACLERALETTMIERESTPLPIVEDEIGELVAQTIEGRGATLVLGAQVTGFDVEDGSVSAVRTDEQTYPADLVIAALGVAPRADLLTEAKTGPKGGYVTDDQQRVLGVQDVWAAGDCVVSVERQTERLVHQPLGTHANKQGLVAGESIAATLGAHWQGRTFDGVIQTAITKICSLEIGRTGLGRADAHDAGIDTVEATIETTTIAGYYPGNEPMTLWGHADVASRRLLGLQLAGGAQSGLRIDVAALAIWNDMTVDDLAMSDLSYAPPFSSVWSPVQVLARSLVKKLGPKPVSHAEPSTA